ncbi:MAG: ABC transporter substrate-binding protein [Sedimentisphaerales bacterium]|nr:ABC transporter substrate-binding protein [Sedimentisphaerales bacterium]
MKNLCYILLILLLAAAAFAAGQDQTDEPDEIQAADQAPPADPNDPNNILLEKYDVVIKDPNDPNEILWAKWNAVVRVLQSKDMEKKVKESLIDRIVTPIFDFPLMAKLVLGRKHWPNFSPPQREKFTKLFTRKLKDSYREKISHYTDEKASVKPLRKKNTTVIIPMNLISQGKEIAIIYKLRKIGKTWKIYDVEIQGVSILLTYRSQFDDVLAGSSVEDLLERLEKPAAP